MASGGRKSRPFLLLYAARYGYKPKNVVAATLAWVAAAHDSLFEVYYDALRDGSHYGGEDPQGSGLAAPMGGLVSGGRHLEAVALALQRFETTVVYSGSVSIANTVAALADVSDAIVHRLEEDDIPGLYETVFSSFHVPWPSSAVMVNAHPWPELKGIDAYCYPEILYRHAVGIENDISRSDLESLWGRGVQEILTCGVVKERQRQIASLGFQVRDLDVIRTGDDFATVTSRLAERWRDRRRGWLLGDPALVSSWLPTACREHRTAIYSVPQSRVLSLVGDDMIGSTVPVLGRQFEDADFFDLSRLGQSFQLVDPGRPPLPVLRTASSSWPSSAPDPRAEDPTDDELRTYARDGRVLVSLVFWTGMLREMENLYALMDLIALTGLRAGMALTVQSLAWRPSPLDLLTVPRDQGGVFPLVELLLASCGTGAAIESLLAPEQLASHLHRACCDLEEMGIPRSLRPEGWWATMDAPLLLREEKARPARLMLTRPFLQVRYHRDSTRLYPATGTVVSGRSHRGMVRRLREVVRDSRIGQFFQPYRPYENFQPGPCVPALLDVVKDAGFSYVLSKSGFGQSPRIVHRDSDFVALNYTAGRWDGWTPFETINDIRDLQRAERQLLARGEPGWLLGGIDSCLWTFTGELWHRAPGLAAIARQAASGGKSGRLINVAPRVLARYARLIAP